MSHTITITRLPDETSDDVEYTVGGTCEPGCRIWRECKRKACRALSADFDVPTERTRHGVEHQLIGGVGWAVETNTCGVTYAYYLTLDAEREGKLGTFPLEISWDGDFWDAFIDSSNPAVGVDKP